MKFDETLMTCVRHDLDNGLIPMLLGEPGIGKSSWLAALADLMHTKCFVLPCNQLADKADLTGARLIPVMDAAGNTVSYKQMFYPHATIHDAIEYALANPRETPILFLDELNRTTPDVTSEALSIPTLRAIGSTELPKNLRVVTAGNDKGNVTSLDTASISRFVLYHVEPDVGTFLGLDPDLNIFVKNILQAHPECIFCKKLIVTTGSGDDASDDDSLDDILEDLDDMEQITTPRTLSGISRWLNSFTNQELLGLLANTSIKDGVETSALQNAIEGHVGQTTFAALLLAEITNGITSINNQANAMTIGKPAVYDKMKACQNMTDLSAFVMNMSENDKSGSLLYAIYEKADNTHVINALAKNIKKLMPNDMKTLMGLAKADMLDAENAHALLATNTPISSALSVILELTE